MREPMKNIAKAEVLVLKDQVAYQEDQVVSRTLAHNDAVSVTLCYYDRFTIPKEKWNKSRQFDGFYERRERVLRQNLRQ